MSISRRDLLRLAGVCGADLAIGGLGLGALASCGDNFATRPPGADHAAMIVEPDADSFVIAVWSLTARAVAIEVKSGGNVVYTTTAELSSRHAVIDVFGLPSDQAYEVTIVSDDGALLGPHHVRTAPADHDTRPVRLAISADIDPNPEFASDLFRVIAATSPELFMTIGDFPYADDGPGPAMTVAEYRKRHVEARTEPRIREWLQTVGVRAIYDDHEFRNDWDGHYREAESARFAAAMQVWDEMFPLAATRRAAGDDVRYRQWRWGAHVECFMLDCRRFRSPNAAPDGETKTMLGAAQRAWLVSALKASTAPFKLVLTSVPLDYGDGDDHWASFAVERDAILSSLLGVPGILFLAGDQHVFGAHRHAFGVREFQVGPLARGIGAPQRTAPGVLFRAARMNFGLLDIDGETLVFSAIGTGGEVFYTERFTPADLTPRTA